MPDLSQYYPPRLSVAPEGRAGPAPVVLPLHQRPPPVAPTLVVVVFPDPARLTGCPAQITESTLRPDKAGHFLYSGKINRFLIVKVGGKIQPALPVLVI